MGNKLKNRKKNIVTINQEIEELRTTYMSRNTKLAEQLAIAFNQKYKKQVFGWKILGAIYQETNRLSESIEVTKKGLEIAPNDPELHLNISNPLRQTRKYVEAEAHCKRSIEINPNIPDAYNNLGSVFRETSKFIKALNSFQKALEINKNQTNAQNNLALVLMDLGDISGAQLCYREALKLAPNNFTYYDNLLFLLNYDDRLSAKEIYSEYENYHLVISRAVTHRYEHINKISSNNKKIRIGYSSPDFKLHACLYFIEPILRNHDHSKFEFYAYANVLVPDNHTERLKKYFDVWVDVTGMDDQQMAQRIVDDKIDILVDLAGHTLGNRLLVFAMRPAPIQVTYLGYGCTTGLKEIDYFIGDDLLTPSGCEPYFSEKIWRVPSPLYCYEPPRDNTPEVNALPAIRNGFITFGSLTRAIRLNDHLLKVWKSILDAIPNSRLRLDQMLFSDLETREFYYKRLVNLGFRREQVELKFSAPHWNVYHDIDIALDCFPHNTGTTTYDALWMGVPVLSKTDRPSVGRLGISILNHVGLNDWVTEDEESYINKAILFSSDTDNLQSLRATLRSRLEKSALMDFSGMAKKLEAGYEEMVLLRQRESV